MMKAAAAVGVGRRWLVLGVLLHCGERYVF
jgi:hypothetical protein